MPTITRHGGATYAGHERNEVTGEWLPANLEDNASVQLNEEAPSPRLTARSRHRRSTRDT